MLQWFSQKVAEIDNIESDTMVTVSGDQTVVAIKLSPIGNGVPNER